MTSIRDIAERAALTYHWRTFASPQESLAQLADIIEAACEKAVKQAEAKNVPARGTRIETNLS